jgi:hypothetical protein
MQLDGSLQTAIAPRRQCLANFVTVMLVTAKVLAWERRTHARVVPAGWPGPLVQRGWGCPIRRTRNPGGHHKRAVLYIGSYQVKRGQLEEARHRLRDVSAGALGTSLTSGEGVEAGTVYDVRTTPSMGGLAEGTGTVLDHLPDRTVFGRRLRKFRPRPDGRRDTDGDALDMEVHRFRIIYNTIRPHQAPGDRTPSAAYTGCDQQKTAR